jgi:hypothetical protein
MSETHKRTWVRTLSYRFLAMLITALWTGLTSAVEIHIALAVLHYVMERVWLKIKWGKT